MVRVELDSGAVLEVSSGHPTADGRTFADLLGGGQLDRAHAIRSAELVNYPHARTYDILPGSSSGQYFAGGALIGSTLVKPTPTQAGGRARRVVQGRMAGDGVPE